MKRVIMTLAVALLATACIDPDGERGHGGPYGHDGCRKFTSCATCTPVLGCGWCSMGTKGLCTDQPNACLVSGVTNFSWTWELNFCPAAADAGTGGDGGANADGGVVTEGGVTADGGTGSNGDAGDGA